MSVDKLKDQLEAIDYWQEKFAHKTFMKALIAVVELHKPVKDQWIDYVTCTGCRVGDDDYYSPEYPCPTIQAIEKILK